MTLFKLLDITNKEVPRWVGTFTSREEAMKFHSDHFSWDFFIDEEEIRSKVTVSKVNIKSPIDKLRDKVILYEMVLNKISDRCDQSNSLLATEIKVMCDFALSEEES